MYAPCTGRTDSSVSGVVSSRTSKSDGLRSATTRPRESVAIRSNVTKRPAGGACAETAMAATRIAIAVRIEALIPVLT